MNAQVDKGNLHRRLTKFVSSAHTLNVVLMLALTVQVIQNQTLMGRFSASPSGLSKVVSDNTQVPPISLFTLDGEEYRIDEGQELRWLLIFFHTKCKYCHVEIPLWNKINKETQERHIDVVAVTLEQDIEALKRFAQEFQLEIPILVDRDGKAFELLEVKATPTKVLLSEDRRIFYVWKGLTSRSAPLSEIISLAATFDLTREDLPTLPMN